MTSLTLETTYLDLRRIGPWLTDEVDAVVPPEVELAVHELACNVIDHARPDDGRIELTAETDAGDLRVELCDRGAPFVAEDVVVPQPGTIQEGGYGLFLLEAVAREITYERRGDTNHWKLWFVIAADAATEVAVPDTEVAR